MVKTFTTLCALADFDEGDVEEQLHTSAEESDTLHNTVTGYPIRRNSPQMGTVALSGLQVNLHLPAADNPAIYDAIFRSFARYVMGRKDDEADTTNVKPDETK